MPWLIDGYNLLNAAGLVSENGPSSLEHSRQLVVSFVAAAVPREQWGGITIVFDGRNAPPGLPSQYSMSGISVRFAPRNQEADDLLEQLIVACHSPRRLVVVSSDHRVQRAAKRRRAQAIDSEKWVAEIWRTRKQRGTAMDITEPEKKPFLSPDEWLAFFSSLSQAATGQPDAQVAPSKEANSPDSEVDVYNPFPNGYADDVLNEEHSVKLPRKGRKKK